MVAAEDQALATLWLPISGHWWGAAVRWGSWGEVEDMWRIFVISNTVDTNATQKHVYSPGAVCGQGGSPPAPGEKLHEYKMLQENNAREHYSMSIVNLSHNT